MEFSIKTCLLDIQQSINEIFEFLGDKRDFKAYQKDLKTKKAVERNVESGICIRLSITGQNTFEIGRKLSFSHSPYY